MLPRLANSVEKKMVVSGLKPRYVEIPTNEVDGREKKVRFRRGR